MWLSGSLELAYAIERKLFDRGCLVHVLSGDADGRVLSALNEAGLIVIRVGPVVGPPIPGRSIEVDAATLPSDLDAAAGEVCHVLESSGVILPRSDMFLGDGI